MEPLARAKTRITAYNEGIMNETEITNGDIATEEIQSESASPAAQPTTEEAAQPAKPALQPVVDEHGPIPFERHEAILGKTRRDADERFARVSWAEGLTRDEVERAIALDRLYRTNPERLASHLSERSKASAEPQPDVKDEHGQPFYSPQQAAKWATWQSQKEIAALRAEMDERYGPIESSFSEQRKYDAAEAQINQAWTWPGFQDHVADITAVVTAARNRGESITLAEAYIIAGVPQKIASVADSTWAERKKQWAKEQTETTERVQDDVNPRRVAASSRKSEDEMSDTELLEHFSKQAVAR